MGSVIADPQVHEYSLIAVHDQLTFPEFVKRLDDWGQNRIAFFFMVDFEQRKPVAVPLTEIDRHEILFDFNGKTNVRSITAPHLFNITPQPISRHDFQRKFDHVMCALSYGDSFLTNLTIKTPIRIEGELADLFHMAKARYKLLYKNRFLVFSPEIFVQIEKRKIRSFPMKGTIDASLPDAEQTILSDIKELAEHVTIVDLIRNDLSTVADHVHVKRFRYIDKIATRDKHLLQVSSEIEGNLGELQNRFGSILEQLLPAGSVSGAPKPKTLQIIREAEGETRGYYTGVAGIFDGVTFDSCVMIRFIEQENGHYFYRSGGGITSQSQLDREYEEMIDKIYVPVD